MYTTVLVLENEKVTGWQEPLLYFFGSILDLFGQSKNACSSILCIDAYRGRKNNGMDDGR